MALKANKDVLDFDGLLSAVRHRAQFIAAEAEGIPVGSFVSVLADRSVDSAVNILACLAGRIPFGLINPESPAERQRLLHEKLGGFPLVLGSSQHTQGDFHFDGARLLRPRLSFSEASWPNSERDGSNPGLVLFTSGSTGIPKGAVWSFDTIATRVDMAATRMSLVDGEARIPNLNPLYWVSGLNTLNLTMFGASVKFIDPMILQPSEIVQQIAEFSPTQITLGPHMARIVADAVAGRGLLFPDLVKVATGGDVGRFEFFQGLREAVRPQTELAHFFGSTEAAQSFAYSTTFGTMPRSGQIPLGAICDPETLHLEPFDGERFAIWRSGPILSEYVRDDALNTAHFDVDQNGVRWWKSEDLVRYQGDNQWIFDCRLTDLREAPETTTSSAVIQELLADHPKIAASLVLWNNSEGRESFVAHIEPLPDGLLSEEEVRTHLEAGVPHGAIIGQFVFHHRLPSNERGKVDRIALNKQLTTVKEG